MGNDNSPENFAKQKRAAIVAPAGYGKTELIVRTVAFTEGRQLVLTHTHAGVDSLRKRFGKRNIASSRFNVETIHSFALRFAGSYPKTTNLPFEKPQENEEYDQVISSATNLFDIKLGKDILRHSYSGIFVDEYQDCDINQHQLICKLADTLPCRIVGDPLQGIYDFGNNQIVDWETNVNQFFSPLPDLTVPYRWKESNLSLGEYLKAIRQLIMNRQQIGFKNVIEASQKEIFKFLKYTSFGRDTVYVICSPTNEHYPHSLAQQLGNKFRTIEPLTSKRLCEEAQKIESTHGQDRLKNVIKFAEGCLTNISTEFDGVFNNLEGNFRNERKIKLKELFKRICENEKLQHVYDLFKFLEDNYAPTYKRHQFWHEMKKGLYEVIMGNYKSLEEAVWHVRSQSKFNENRIPKYCISRTLLLKGLECDHAVIIQPELFDAKNLYVALTRPSSSLTIISNSQTWAKYS